MVAPQLQQEKKPLDVPDVNVVVLEDDQPGQKWTRKELYVSSIGFLCCQLVGLPALIMSIFSYVDHSNRSYAESQRKRRRANRLGWVAIILGTLIVLMMLPWMCPAFRRWYHEKKAEWREHHHMRNDAITMPRHHEQFHLPREMLERLPPTHRERMHGMMVTLQKIDPEENPDIVMKMCMAAKKANEEINQLVQAGEIPREAANVARMAAMKICSLMKPKPVPE